MPSLHCQAVKQTHLGAIEIEIELLLSMEGVWKDREPKAFYKESVLVLRTSQFLTLQQNTTIKDT